MKVLFTTFRKVVSALWNCLLVRSTLSYHPTSNPGRVVILRLLLVSAVLSSLVRIISDLSTCCLIKNDHEYLHERGNAKNASIIFIIINVTTTQIHSDEIDLVLGREFQKIYSMSCRCLVRYYPLHRYGYFE